MKDQDSNASGGGRQQCGRRVVRWVVAGLVLGLIGVVGIRKYREVQAAEGRLQEQAKAQAARIKAEETLQNARKFFADGKWDDAAIWCEKAAVAGDVSAQRNWGICLEKGLGVKASPEEAVKWYRKAMAAGDSAAKIRLAGCLLQGSGLTKDTAAALQLYQEAAGAGEVDAQLALGELLLEGKDVEKSPGEAVGWLRKAAEQGNAQAQARLGDCLYKGAGVTVDFTEAAKWLKQAADLGNPDACNAMGLRYCEGMGVEVDREKGMALLKRAAEGGVAIAGRNVGLKYFYRGDNESAAKWLRRGAELGDEVARFQLGWLLTEGKGVPMNKEEAVTWYRKSAGSQNLGAPALGAWATYGLGSENQNLPGFIVLTSGGKNPDAGKSVWGAGYLPSVYQGVQCRSQGDPVLYLGDPPGIARLARVKVSNQ